MEDSNNRLGNRVAEQFARDTIRALVVRQPYAELIASGTKREEFRSWPTHHRGRLLIIAAKGATAADVNAARKANPRFDFSARGVAVCTVDVTDCRPRRGGNGFAWQLANVRRVAPVAVSGKLGLFTVDALTFEPVAATKRPAREPRTELRAKVARGSTGGPWEQAARAAGLKLVPA